MDGTNIDLVTQIKYDTTYELTRNLFEIYKKYLDITGEAPHCYRQQEQENRKAFGKSYVESGYIFKWDDGRPYSPDFISQKFDKLLKQYGFPQIRFHELRKHADCDGF